jgi:hypothetical protein
LVEHISEILLNQWWPNGTATMARSKLSGRVVDPVSADVRQPSSSPYGTCALILVPVSGMRDGTVEPATASMREE